MSRTNIELDDELIDRAMRLAWARTKREVVDLALRQLVEKGGLYRAIRRLRGKLAWRSDMGAWRASRSART